MLIDAHIHIFAKEWLPNWLRDVLCALVARSHGLSIEQAKVLCENSWGSTGNTAVAEMDKVGVERSVVCVLDHGPEIHEDAISIEEINRQTAAMVKRHPQRLIFACGVDPRRKNAVSILETSVKEWGAKSLKLFPPAGWYPNERMAYPLYERCVELGIPVNFHTGYIAGPVRGKYAHPQYFDDVAVDFPELTIHCTHMGQGSFMEMLAVARARPNIVCDFAGWLPWVQSSQPLDFYKTWRYIADMLGPGRLMFASDYLGVKNDPCYSAWVKAVTKIPKEVMEAGIEFSKEELEEFYSGTAARILKL